MSQLTPFSCNRGGTLRRHFRHGATMTRLSRGFSLVEIMVGMVIGLLGIIIMMQVYAVFEGQKRTTTGGSDAQSTAAIALHGMTQDVQQAGYGISVRTLFNCNFSATGTVIPLAPVTINAASGIIPAGDSNTDTLLVFYGNTNNLPQGNRIDGITGNDLSVFAPASFNNLDRVIAVPKTCAPSTPLVLSTVSGVPGTLAVTVTPTVANAQSVYNLGQIPQLKAYAVRNNSLTVCDYLMNNCGDIAQVNNQAVWVPIANDIVSMRALYGRDTVAGGGSPTNYVANLYDQTTPTTGCGWARTVAIQLALVARNGQYDKTTSPLPTVSAPVWAGSATAPIDLTKKPDGTANPDWQHYRYKVLQTVIPLRNVIWMGVDPGC